MSYFRSFRGLLTLLIISSPIELRLYEQAVKDASDAIDEGFSLPKAYFRRGQARRLLGEWAEAEDDLKEALSLQPGDPSIVQEIAELRRLGSVASSERDAWIAEQNKQTIEDLFPDGGLQRAIKEKLAEA